MRLIVFFIAILTVNQIFSQVINIEKKRQEQKSSFFGSVNISFDYERSSKKLWTSGNNTNLNYRYKSHLIMSFTNWNFTNSGNEKIQNDGYEHLRYNFRPDSILTPEAFGQYQFNDLRNIKYRTLGGFGLRIKLFSNDTTNLHMGTSIMYEERYFTYQSTGQQHWRLNLYTNINWDITKTLNLSGIIYFQPALDDFQNHNVSGEGRFSIQLINRLRLVLSAELTYETEPPLGLSEFYSKFKSGLFYSF